MMTQPDTIGELNDNLDIPQFDEWANGILKLATDLRMSADMKDTGIFQFNETIYSVTVEELNDNFDISQFDEWADGVLNAATNMRTSSDMKCTEISVFNDSIYRVTVEKIDNIDDDSPY